MVYAVIASGGKQYRIAEGQTLKVEKLPGEVGQKIQFDQILMIANGDDITLGAPYLKGAKVSAEVVEHGRSPKIHILKFRRRKHHMKQMGHRQDFTTVKILGIESQRKSKKASEEE